MKQAFVTQMKNQLGEEAELYFNALREEYVRGIRLNTAKIHHSLPEGLLGRVPWAGENAYYLANDSAAGSHPLHEAGAWYIQEPSAMASVSALRPQKGEKILDLCAAPGGKSTQIAEVLQGSGVLVCNEPVPSRAKILSRNIERMGIVNALVVSADPSQLSKCWPNAFDAVLVDAPCSGEGMFRRHPETMDEWNEGSPEGCSERQSAILEEAVRMVRPGGRLVYSTCTFNTVENEQVIENLLQQHPEWEPFPFRLNGVEEAKDGWVHLYPHRLRGEGHFVALLHKVGEGATHFLPPSECLTAPGKALLTAWQEFAKGRRLPAPNAAFGDTLLSAPELPPLKGIKVLRAGLQLGACKGSVFIPDHALALSLQGEMPFPAIPLSLEEAKHYQAGETLPVHEPLHGWVLPTLEGTVLGFGKASDGQMKNHYPKGLRKG